MVVARKYRKLTEKIAEFILPERPNLFFMHVAKTGGTSIDYAIRNHYINKYARVEAAPTYQTAEKIYGQSYDNGEIPNAFKLRETIALYEMFKGTKYISGHVTFNLDTWQEFGSKYLYLTCLRDPVKRYISQYFYNIYKKSNHRKLNVDLPTYITMPRGQHEGSVYVKFFGGISEVSDYKSTEAIERAKHNLAKFNLVAFLEDLNVFVAEFAEKTGIKLRIPHKRKNPVSKPEVDKDLLAKIETICTPDLEIYEYARNKYLNK